MVKKEPDSKSVDVEAMKSMGAKYEDILEPQMKELYVRVVNFIAISQIPLVHVNTVIDLIKIDLLKQLHDGYFPGGK